MTQGISLHFVHGFLGSSFNWNPVINQLRSRQELSSFNVEYFAYDMLGHGKKANLANGTNLTVQLIAEDLNKEISHNLQKEDSQIAVAVGHSFGLRPLLWLEAQKHLFDVLVVEDSSPVVSDQGFGELMTIFERIRPPFASRAKAKENIESHFGVDSRMSRFLLTNIRETESGEYSWRFNEGALRSLLVDAHDHPQWKEREQIEKPIYMVMGQNSGFVSKDRQKECVERRPGKITNVAQIAQSGHWVHADQLNLFCDELVRIIKESIL